MKKILSLIMVSTIVLSCSESVIKNTKVDTNKTENVDPLSGTFTSRDAKAQILLKNMNLFANAVWDTAGDTAVFARGKEEAIAYWNNIHSIYEDISFSEGRLQTFELNNGEVWSAYFGELYAVGKFTKENYAIPLNVWIQWENDKIVRQVDMLDSKFINAEIEASEES